MYSVKTWNKFKTSPKMRSFLLTIRLIVTTPAGAVGFAIMVGYFGLALVVQAVPGLIGISDPNTMITNFSNPFPQAPSSAHLFGTTFPGIDLFHGIIKAIRVDVFTCILVVGAGSIIGSIVGVTAGFKGKIVDQVVMRITDIFFSLPFLVLAMAVGFVLGRSLTGVILALIIVWWPMYARLTRSQTLYLKNELYVKFSVLSGNSTFKTIFKHIIPNTITPVLVQMSIDLATIILLLSGLYFIGFAQSSPYLPELGSLIAYGFPFARDAPWTVVFPGLALMLFALGMNLFGDGLRDALNPRFRT